MAGRAGAVLLAAMLLAGCSGPGLAQGRYVTQDHRWQLTVEREEGKERLILSFPNGEEKTFLLEGERLFPAKGDCPWEIPS